MHSPPSAPANVSTRFVFQLNSESNNDNSSSLIIDHYEIEDNKAATETKPPKLPFMNTQAIQNTKQEKNNQVKSTTFESTQLNKNQTISSTNKNSTQTNNIKSTANTISELQAKLASRGGIINNNKGELKASQPSDVVSKNNIATSNNVSSTISTTTNSSHVDKEAIIDLQLKQTNQPTQEEKKKTSIKC